MTYGKEKKEMEYIFSDSLAELRPSAIREIFKSLGDPEMIAFAAGNPSPEAFPVELVRRECGRILAEQPVTALQYGTTEGYTPLRRAIESRLTERFGHTRDGNDVMVTTGGEQGIELACKALCNPGDAVLCEEPSFIGALNSFRSLGAVPVGVPMDADGINVEAFEEAAVRTGARLAYLIPTFQNPSGITMSAEKRRAVYEIACRRSIIIIEDNPYGELRFEGEYMPALKSLDTKGLVIYLGTFSKILAPGYRLGWVCADDAILSKFNFMEQAASLQASTIGQMEVAKWIDMFDLDGHVTKIRECYRKRRTVMLDTLERELPKECTFTHPDGGLFAWVVLPEYMDAKDLQMKCLARKVAFVPGGSFFPNGGHENTLRLNYSCMPEDKIVKGITALCQTIRENLR